MSLKDRLKKKKTFSRPVVKRESPSDDGIWEMFAETARKEAQKILSSAETRISKMTTALFNEVSREVKKIVSNADRQIEQHIKSKSVEIKGEKGDPGKDADEEAIANKVLKKVDLPKVDYTAVRKFISQEVGGLEKPISQPEIEKIAKSVQEEFSGEEVKQRLIELPVKEKWFDYRHLKNVPVDMGEKGGKTLHRGGQGLAVFAEDLSGDTDGSTKTFTVPSHTRAVLLVGSDFPFVYRPTVDFTTSGTTLTIDDAVPAPTNGATLIFTYAK